MKKTKILTLSLLLMGATVAVAQNSIIRGSFKKIEARVMNEEIRVCKNENGTMKQVLGNVLNKQDQTFQFGVDNSLGIFDEILFAGAMNEFYAFYCGKDETIDIQVENGQIHMQGKLSKENALLQKYYDIVNPMRAILYTEKSRTANLMELRNLIDKTTPKAEKFIKKCKSGNKAFDAKIKKLLPYMLMNDVNKLAEDGLSFNTKEEYPKYMQKEFTDYNFTADIFENYPQVFELVSMYAFAKETVFEFKMGNALELYLPQISDEKLKSYMISEAMVRSYLWDPIEFDKKWSLYLLAEDKPRYDAAVAVYKLKQEGADWIDFSYPDAEGKMHSLSDYKGKVIVVEVWATWCAPCKREIPYLEQLQEEMKDKDVVFISVSIDEKIDDWKKFIVEHEMKGVQLISLRKGAIIDNYKVEAVPQFMVFSRDGKVISTDAPRPSTPKLKEMIEKAL